MTLFFDPKNFVVTEFYTYPTCVVNRIVEFEEFGDKKPRFDRADDDVKDFFEDCLKYAEERIGRKLMDNKIAMKVIYPKTNSVLYVGYKDNIYTIGLSLNPYATGRVITI